MRHPGAMYRDAANPGRDLLITAFASQVFAVERATGLLRWHLRIEDSTFAGVIDLHIGATVVLAVNMAHLVFIEYATGKLLRKVKQAGEYAAVRPIVLLDGEHIFVGRHGEAACYTLSGDPVWVQSFPGKGVGHMSLGFPGNVRQGDDR